MVRGCVRDFKDLAIGPVARPLLWVALMMKYLSVALLVTAASCASDDQPVTGTWRVLPNAFADEGDLVVGPDEWTFRDDGTLTASSSDDSAEGRFEIAGDRLFVSLAADGDTFELETGFVRTPERLLMGVLFPEGEVDGALGAWSDHAVINGRESHRSLVLDAEGSAVSETDGESDTGTWAEDGESIELRFDSHTEHWFRIGEQGIGDILLKKVE